MNPKRRQFWKFFAAAPAALVAPLIASKPATEVSAKDIVIEGNNVTLNGWNVANAGIKIKGGASHINLSGIYIRDV